MDISSIFSINIDMSTISYNNQIYATINPKGFFEFPNNTGIKLPIGNNAQRLDEIGLIRYNEQTGYFEGFGNNGWVNLLDSFSNTLTTNGGELTGSLILSKNPEEDFEAATKIYVDNNISKPKILSISKDGEYILISSGHNTKINRIIININNQFNQEATVTIGDISNNSRILAFNDIDLTIQNTYSFDIDEDISNKELTLYANNIELGSLEITIFYQSF